MFVYLLSAQNPSTNTLNLFCHSICPTAALNCVCLLSLSQRSEAVLDSRTPFTPHNPFHSFPCLGMCMLEILKSPQWLVVIKLLVKCLDVSFVAQTLWTEQMKIKLSSMCEARKTPIGVKAAFLVFFILSAHQQCPVPGLWLAGNCHYSVVVIKWLGLNTFRHTGRS